MKRLVAKGHVDPHACGCTAALPPKAGAQFAPWGGPAALMWTPTLAAAPLRCPQKRGRPRRGMARRRSSTLVARTWRHDLARRSLRVVLGGRNHPVTGAWRRRCTLFPIRERRDAALTHAWLR